MDKTLDEIAGHLEFLGYKLTKTEFEKKDGSYFYIADEPDTYMILLLKSTDLSVILRSSIRIDKKYSSDIDKFINKANSIFDVARIYSEVDSDGLILRFDSLYFGEYRKDLFAEFIKFFIKDQRKIGILNDEMKVL